jgi:hypothetical protein
MDHVEMQRPLVLRGIFPQDFTKPVAPVASDASAQDRALVYTEIPKRFTGVESWPRYSNLKCWYCGLVPASYPCFVPKNIESDGTEDACDPEGVFNTWNCVVAYIMKNYPPTQWWELNEAVLIFESKFSGCRRKKIMPAPPPTLRKEYCGANGITEKQYIEKIENINKDYSL